jgi:sulfite reductase alpha subunit-like flavoprotein
VQNNDKDVRKFLDLLGLADSSDCNVQVKGKHTSPQIPLKEFVMYYINANGQPFQLLSSKSIILPLVMISKRNCWS